MAGESTTTSVLRRIERLARAMRYRQTGECIPPADLDPYTDDELAAMLCAAVRDATEAA